MSRRRGDMGIACDRPFREYRLNPSGANGWLYGNPALFGIQAFAVAVVALFSFVGSYMLLKVINLITPIRVSAKRKKRDSTLASTAK